MLSSFVSSSPAAEWQVATQALHAALVPDPVTRSIQPTLSPSVNQLFDPGQAAFSADGVDDLAALLFLYARWGNPTVRQLERRLTDVQALAELAHAYGAWLSVDSTLTTPVITRPLTLGADLGAFPHQVHERSRRRAGRLCGARASPDGFLLSRKRRGLNRRSRLTRGA